MFTDYLSGKSFPCGNSNVCISFSQICDGENDCPNGEDESECIALVNGNQTLDSIGKLFNKKGILYLRKKGKWAPLCLDNLNSANDLESNDKTAINNIVKLKLEDLGKAVCSSQSFREMKTIEVTKSNDQNEFYDLEYPTNLLYAGSR